MTTTTTHRRPGRPTRGVQRIDDYEGSALAKERAKALLVAIVGDDAITTQLESLGICRTRFATLRDRGIRALIDAMEPRVGGRRAACDEAAPAVDPKLLDEIALLKWELEAAEVREQVHRILPSLAADRRRGATRGRSA
jgi:hypothetical protein